MHKTLQLHLQKQQYSTMIARYHFNPDDLEQIYQMGRQVEEIAEPEVYFRIPEEGGRMPVIVTLGRQIDDLQEQYMSRERLTESYMIECIAMELLQNAYEQAAESIYGCTGRWMTGFAFLGEQVPLTYMEEIFRCLKPEKISYNQAYMLTPKKTVAFLADLCKERGEGGYRVCMGCGNRTCPNRCLSLADGVQQIEKRRAEQGKAAGQGQEIKPEGYLTYGYQKIFGKGNNKFLGSR